jgi:hypothetical protein
LMQSGLLGRVTPRIRHQLGGRLGQGPRAPARPRRRPKRAAACSSIAARARPCTASPAPPAPRVHVHAQHLHAPRACACLPLPPAGPPACRAARRHPGSSQLAAAAVGERPTWAVAGRRWCTSPEGPGASRATATSPSANTRSQPLTRRLGSCAVAVAGGSMHRGVGRGRACKLEQRRVWPPAVFL